MSRVDQYDISVALDTTPLGTFDKMSGGQVDSEETKYKPGGMVPQVTLGGSVTVSNVTVERLFRLDRDLPLVPTLKSRVGKGLITVTKQSLDVDGHKYGNPIVYEGIMKQLTLPDPDSEGTGAALMQIEVSTVGQISG
jgi:hypothetical protein